MAFTRDNLTNGLETISELPAGVTSECTEALEDVAYLSGIGLGHLHSVFA